MKRREFITLISGAAATWPMVAHGQQAGMPVIVFLYPGVPEANTNLVAAFRKGLSETGYVEGQNVAIEYHWAHNQYDLLPSVAADLVRRKVTVIAALGGSTTALAVKAATSTIPIVFAMSSDPVQAGLVSSLNRPGGNVTGINAIDLQSKQIGILHDLMPRSVRLGMLIYPPIKTGQIYREQGQTMASALGRHIGFFNATTGREIDEAFTRMVQDRIEAVVIPPSPFFLDRRVHIATLAVRKGIATICAIREFAEAGGLMSYGTRREESYRLAAMYVGRILKGEKPADLPVMRATKFEFVINLQTARTIGLDVPVTLLAIADGIID